MNYTTGSSMTTTGFGRKKRIDIWTHFRYHETEKKTECIALLEGKQCGHKIAGKNTTHLKRHIKARHKEIEVKRRLEVEDVFSLFFKNGDGATEGQKPMASLSHTDGKTSTPNSIGNTPLIVRSRFDTSLGFLTRRFAELMSHSADGILDLNLVAQKLNAPKRRVYDVTNVLEGVQLIKKKSKNQIQWLGNQINRPPLQELRDLVDEEKKLDELIQSCAVQVHQLCENQHCQRFAYLTYDDVRRISSLKEQTVIVIKAPEETKLEVPNPEESLQIHLSSTKGPIEVFVCSDHPMPMEVTDSCLADDDHDSSTDGNSSISHVSDSSSFLMYSKDHANHPSGMTCISTLPTQSKQNSSAATVSPVTPTSTSCQQPAEDQQSFVTLTPPLNLSFDREEYLMSLAEDEGITDLFSSADLEQSPLDQPV